MAVLERLGAPELRAVVRGYRDALRAHQDAINRQGNSYLKSRFPLLDYIKTASIQ